MNFTAMQDQNKCVGQWNARVGYRVGDIKLYRDQVDDFYIICLEFESNIVQKSADRALDRVQLS